MSTAIHRLHPLPPFPKTSEESLARIAVALERIAPALIRMADRFDADALTFDEMVGKGKGLSA